MLKKIPRPFFWVLNSFALIPIALIILIVVYAVRNAADGMSLVDSVVLVALMIGLFPLRYSRTADWFWVVGIYALAKVAEALDQPIMSLTKVVSGHTLKHLVAAVAVFWLLRMLTKRTPERPELSRSRASACAIEWA